MFLDLNPGHVLVFGECGGKMLWHPSRSQVPKKYHLFLLFDDDSFFTATTQMWGAMELYEKGKEKKRQYVKDMRVTPTEKQFTYDYFSNLVDSQKIKGKMNAKELLTQHQIMPGLGNAMAQDILFKARLHPRYSINK